jgi:sugar lactone lactonase YvrE
MKLQKTFSFALLIYSAIIFLNSCSKKSNINPDDNPEPANIPGHTYTLAGSSTLGLINGSRTLANFSNPDGVAIDAAGNLYVADKANNVIRKITTDGFVTIFAGNGNVGSADGSATAATFNEPLGIAVSPTGDVFVTDLGNNLIRKITPAGNVSTYAGSGVRGANDGVGISATFNNPTGITVDHSGNVYVGDNNSLIREITPDQTVTTIAGHIGGPIFVNGTGISANFSDTFGLAVDASNNIYVADSFNNMIRKITPQRVVTTLAGQTTVGSANGNTATATFNSPLDLAVDAKGNVYVNDTGNNLIRKIATNGTVTTVAGTGVKGFNDGENLKAQFNQLHGIAVDANGYLYVGDEQNARIRKVIPN